MESQGEIIRRLDEQTDHIAQAAGGGRVSTISSFISLTLFPALTFIKTLTLGGALFRGVEGLREAGNAWALDFVTRAKQYEKEEGAPLPSTDNKAGNL